MIERLTHGKGQILPVADEGETYVFLHELGQLLTHEAQKQLEKKAHFLFGPLPVFLGKGIHGDVPYAPAPAFAHQRAHGVHAGEMSFGAGEPPFSGPSAVAVHDDRNVLRQSLFHAPFHVDAGPLLRLPARMTRKARLAPAFLPDAGLHVVRFP